ncbi:hypothetical protein LCGC14_2129870, partial [marine sediment metagenome]
MIVENISEGLKLAVSKGETLQQAMQSFYNAGYKKENIESAARLLTPNVTQPIQPQESKIQQISQKKQPIIPQQPQLKPVQKVSGYGQPLPQQQVPLPPKPVQKVSSYGAKKQRNPKVIMIILVIILLIVFGGA